MSLDGSLLPKSTFYVLRAQFIYQDYSLYPNSTVYVSRLQYMSQEYIHCHK